MDGLGRVIQRQGEGESQPIIQDTWYEERGQVAKESVPYWGTGTLGVYQTPQSQPFTQYAYDGLGRVRVVTAPDGTQTRTYYRGYKTAVIDANGHMTQQEVDDWGRLVASHQYTGTYNSGVNWEVTPYATATYGYDVMDRLTDVYGPGTDEPLDMNNHTRIAYDLAGRKTSMSDPDMGTWSYAYDAVGNLIRQTDARQKTLCYQYDALNRLNYVREDRTDPPDGDCEGTLYWLASYYWDHLPYQNPPPYGVGQRIRMDDRSGQTSWEYDARGRVRQETKTINGAGTFITQWTYDALDRVKTMTYPDNEVVTYAYNAQGLAESLTSSIFGDIVISSAYNAAGQVTERRLGTGPGSRVEYKQQFAYDPQTLRLTTLKAVKDGEALLNMSYEYDAVGNVLSITDSATSGETQTQAFKQEDGTPGYDELNRLERAQASGGSDGEYGPYDYGYGANGNMTGFEGKSFAYNDANHPHGVTHVNGEQKYWYDANGNVKHRMGSWGDFALEYDAENRLIAITRTLDSGVVATYAYAYDGDGERVKEGKTNYTRYFVGDYYEVEGSIVRKYYSLGGVRVAESYNGTLYFLLTDHLGSTALTTTREGEGVGELRYYPYGVWRYKWGAPKTSYRYTGQRWDWGTGLYWYRSRWYDPEIGRFIQPDTIVPNPGDPQSLNRYSYVGNNPVRYTDPSGHMIVQEDNDVNCRVIGGCQVAANDGFMEGALSPEVLEAAQEAMEELKIATDPSMIHIVRDHEGNIDPVATLTASTKILPALHACALAVDGACSVSISEAGYGSGLGERGSFDIWVSSDKQMAVTATFGGGAYASPQVGGGSFSASVNVLPGANINDVGQWFVQTGGSIVYVEGVGGEMFFVKTDHGVLSGLSGSWSSGGGLEWHASATYSWFILDPVILP